VATHISGHFPCGNEATLW